MENKTINKILYIAIGIVILIMAIGGIYLVFGGSKKLTTSTPKSTGNSNQNQSNGNTNPYYTSSTKDTNSSGSFLSSLGNALINMFGNIKPGSLVKPKNNTPGNAPQGTGSPHQIDFANGWYVDQDGFAYDADGNYVGEMDADGRIYDGSGTYIGDAEGDPNGLPYYDENYANQDWGGTDDVGGGNVYDGGTGGGDPGNNPGWDDLEDLQYA